VEKRSHPPATTKPVLGVDFDSVPWVPVSERSWFKPVRFAADGDGWANYVRVLSGGIIPRSRVTGGADAYTFSGTWRDLVTGCLSAPGSYTFEPPGTPHEAIVEGAEDMIALFIVRGQVEYLDRADTVLRTDTAAAKEDAYLRYCVEHHVPPLDLRA
jgi:hypothetical protein